MSINGIASFSSKMIRFTHECLHFCLRRVAIMSINGTVSFSQKYTFYLWVLAFLSEEGRYHVHKWDGEIFDKK